MPELLDNHALLTYRHQCIDEILNREGTVHESGDAGVEAMDKEDIEGQDSDEDLERKTVTELTAIAKEREINMPVRARKAIIVEALRKGMQKKKAGSHTRLALDHTKTGANIQGFNADMITPYFHTLAAHISEQMITLSTLGQFIGHPITHKHCSCSPCELSNNRYNRTYFQRCSRRLTGLEAENLLLAWRCTVNREDIDRSKYTCKCGKAFMRKGWLAKHIQLHADNKQK